MPLLKYTYAGDNRTIFCAGWIATDHYYYTETKGIDSRVGGEGNWKWFTLPTHPPYWLSIWQGRGDKQLERRALFTTLICVSRPAEVLSPVGCLSPRLPHFPWQERNQVAIALLRDQNNKQLLWFSVSTLSFFSSTVHAIIMQKHKSSVVVRKRLLRGSQSHSFSRRFPTAVFAITFGYSSVVAIVIGSHSTGHDEPRKKVGLMIAGLKWQVEIGTKEPSPSVFAATKGTYRQIYLGIWVETRCRSSSPAVASAELNEKSIGIYF